MKQILTLLEADHLEGTDLEEVVDTCGFDTARTLLDRHYGTIYIPKIVSIEPLMIEYIRQELNNGTFNARVIARDLGCSESTVRYISRKIYNTKGV